MKNQGLGFCAEGTCRGFQRGQNDILTYLYTWVYIIQKLWILSVSATQ